MDACRFRALIFDMDGTLTRPTLDFAAIRREIGVPAGDLTAEIPKLPPGRQRKAWAVIEAHEEEAMRRQELQEGSEELLQTCRRRSVRVGVVTRNAKRSVDHLCRRYGLRFDAVITREFPFVKPHPAPILHMLEQWRIQPGDALAIGDYLHDIECGLAAGTKTCFFQNPGSLSFADRADFAVSSMVELAGIVFPSS